MVDSVQQVSLLAAFTAGLLSFVSPCVLPLVPSYVSYISGLSIEQLTNAAERHRFRGAIIINSLLFILTVTLIEDTRQPKPMQAFRTRGAGKARKPGDGTIPRGRVGATTGARAEADMELEKCLRGKGWAQETRE